MLSKLVLEKLSPHYKEQYGTSTEEVLLGLLQENKKHELKNPFLEENLAKEYFLDKASLLVSHALPLNPGYKVLDMCSAPGGKLLSLIFKKIPRVHFWANDVSINRFNRLKRVLVEYIPPDLIKDYIKITCQDAIKFGIKKPATFDAILLDAPCSSEGHLVKDEKLLKNFKRLSKALPKRQYGLLCSALLSLKAGGFMVYSTCTINKQENDLLLKKFLDKKGLAIDVIELDIPLGQKTAYGYEVLPHLHGAGPFYLSLLKKRTL